MRIREAMTEIPTDAIPGATDLVAWFGRFPRFHDANVVDFQIRADGFGHLKAKAFKMTDKVDEKGYFILEKHCTVTLFFDEITFVNLTGFQPGGAIISDVNIKTESDEFDIAVESSYGFQGSLRSRKLRISFEPDDRAHSAA
jgi:hypothetical protein